MKSLKARTGSLLENVLRPLGFERKARPFSDFIAFQETQRGAKEAGLPVGDFIERKHLAGDKVPSEQTMDGMAALGVFNEKIERVCELGPGSGRYLEKTRTRCNPASYEIYETSQEWRNWLVEKYGVTARESNGRSLSQTDSASVDLVQAHKLFPGLPLLVTLAYFREMARVVRAGGWIVFDVMTEKCFDAANLQAWFDSDPWEWDWSPRMCACQYTLDTFAQLGISFMGSFQVPLYPAITECFVFRKFGAPSAASQHPAGQEL
jgi:phospholipid N-methyltransferase